jgi:acyl-CoA reductase-like NAD-dependent aldehyde dehydrogenase
VAKDLPNVIAGQPADPVSERRSDLVNPSTGEVFATAPVSGPADVDAAFAAASGAFEGWRDATPSERSLALLRIADAIEARAEEFVAIESENTPVTSWNRGRPSRSSSLPPTRGPRTMCTAGSAEQDRPVPAAPLGASP